jgi:hypothetical protein
VTNEQCCHDGYSSALAWVHTIRECLDPPLSPPLDGGFRGLGPSWC